MPRENLWCYRRDEADACYQPKVVICVNSLTYSLTHSLIYSLTHLLIHSLTYFITHSLTHSLTYYEGLEGELTVAAHNVLEEAPLLQK